MDIILDANILIADFGLSGTAFRIAFDGIRRTDCRMYVPEVVFAEVVAKHREHLVDVETDLQRARASLRRLGRRDLADKIIGPQAGDDAAKFAIGFRKSLSASGVRFLAWPDVSHEVVVQRILWGRRPAQKESGYRDALIWETILAHVKGDDATEVVFVTNNSKDFCEDGRLHPHLAHDLSKVAMGSARVAIELSLESLNKRDFEPTLKHLDEVREQLQRRVFPGVDIHKWAETEARDLIEGDDLRGTVIDLPDTCGRMHLSSDAKITEVTVENVRKLSAGELLVEVRTAIAGDVWLTLDEDDVWCPEAREWLGDEPLYGSADISVPETFSATFELVVDKEEILSSELAGVSGNCGESRLARDGA